MTEDSEQRSDEALAERYSEGGTVRPQLNLIRLEPGERVLSLGAIRRLLESEEEE